jgi:predicted transcriptional regulator
MTLKETNSYDINGNPGIRYRELLRLSNLSNGVLTYHLALLEKSYLIQVDRNENKKITRYYPACTGCSDLMNVMYFPLDRLQSDIHQNI